jgi:putative ABC transport system substrate-binding protein
LLVNPNNPNVAEPTTKSLQGAARTLGLEVHVLHASADRDFDTVFATLVQLRAGALCDRPRLFLHYTQRADRRIGISPCDSHHLSVSRVRRGRWSGELWNQYSELVSEVGVYTSRILKGEKPADLPVQQAVKLELAINLKTAKALGITVPISLLGCADEVIE